MRNPKQEKIDELTSQIKTLQGAKSSDFQVIVHNQEGSLTTSYPLYVKDNKYYLRLLDDQIEVLKSILKGLQ